MFNYLHEVRRLKSNKDLRAIHDRAVEAAENLKVCETNVILRLQEVDEFVVHRFLGYQELYQYAIQALRLSEWQASTYVALARKAKVLPALQRAIESGEITVSKAVRITHVINDRNQQYWVGLASTLSKRDLEREVAAHSPRAAVPERVRYLNQTTLELQMPISEEGLNQIERAREVMMSAEGRPLTREEVVIALAQFYLERKDPVRKAERALKRSNQAQKPDGHKSNGKEPDHGPSGDAQSGNLLMLLNDQDSDSAADETCLATKGSHDGSRLPIDTSYSADGITCPSAFVSQPSIISPEVLLTTPDRMRNTESRTSSLPGQAENPTAPDQQINLEIEIPLKRSDDGNTCTDGKAKSLTQPARPHVRRRALKASVRHAATARDQGCCQQRLPNGELCRQKVWTELHHIVPVSHGGTDTVDNLITLCRAHHEMHHLFDELEQDWAAFTQTQGPERFGIPHPHPVNAI